MHDEHNFSNGKRAKNVPRLTQLQSESKGKTRTTIIARQRSAGRLRKRAQEQGVGYQTLINSTLRAVMGSRPVDEDTLRRVLPEELQT